MAVPELKVEMWLGGSWVDLVALGCVDLDAGVSITRGRANEYGQMGAGQCSFVLVNDDGAFTPELPSSPWRSSLTLHRPVRVSVPRPDELDGGDSSSVASGTVDGGTASSTASGTVDGGTASSVPGWTLRFAGFVDDEPVDLEDPTGALAKVTITAVDRYAIMGLPVLRSQKDQRILALAPKAYWPLDDASGATQTNDLMGGPRLVPTQVSTAGTLEFGAEGGPVTGEGAGSANLTRSSATAGLYLLGDGALGSLGVEWSVVSIHNPSASGYLWRLTQGTYILGLYWSSSTSKYSVRQYNGSSWSTLATSSAATTGLHVEVVTVSATQVVLRSDATHTAGARSAATFTAPTVAVGYLVDSTSGFDDLTSALISGVAIVPGVMAMADADTLATNIKSPPSLTTDAFMAVLLGWCGMAASVSWLGDHPSLGYIPTGTQSPASLADTISAGANGRFAVMADGSVCWVDSSYAPALAEIEAEAVSPPLRWARDRSSYVTDVTTSLPSGGSYTYSSPSAGLVRESKSITGVLATDQACRDAAAFLVAGSSLSPRLSQVAFDLLTQPDPAVVAAVLGLDVGSQFALSGLPRQIPDNRTLVVEGLSEVIALRAWTVTVNTSPSSQSLPPTGWYFAWVDGPTTYIDDGLAFIANI